MGMLGDFGRTRGVDSGLVFDTPAPPPQAQGKLSRGQLIAGILADALAGAMGRQGSFAPMMARRAEDQTAFERGEQQYQRQRTDKRADAIWELNNIPKNPYRWEANDGSLMEVGPDGLVRTVYKDQTPKMNFISDGMGGGQWVAMPTQPVQSPADIKPVGKLTPLGGPTPQASGGFR